MPLESHEFLVELQPVSLHQREPDRKDEVEGRLLLRCGHTAAAVVAADVVGVKFSHDGALAGVEVILLNFHIAEDAGKGCRVLLELRDTQRSCRTDLNLLFTT